MQLSAVVQLIREAGSRWMDHRAPRLGAALAFYALFSLAPVLVIVTAIAALFFGVQASQGQIVGQLRELVGEEGGKAVEVMLANANNAHKGTFATVVGIAILLVGAMGLFDELQDSLNLIWGVQPKPGRSWLSILRDRFMSFSMVLCIAFLLLVSLVVSAVLSALTSFLGTWREAVAGQTLELLISLGIITILFALIYRYLPDARIAWRDVWFGAVVTSVLFTVGKLFIGLYLGQAGIGSAYGAAGSFAVLLLWLYYSAQIFLFGAELTRVYADRFGSGVVPAKDAELVRPSTEESKQLVRV